MPGMIGALTEVRDWLRAEGNYALADEIRERLARLGVKLGDDKINILEKQGIDWERLEKIKDEATQKATQLGWRAAELIHEANELRGKAHLLEDLADLYVHTQCKIRYGGKG